MGALIGIIAGTSIVMHFIQHKRRQALRRRISNGEVDLDSLGVKCLTVPQRALDNMPLFVYVSTENNDSTGDMANRTIAPEGAANGNQHGVIMNSDKSAPPSSLHAVANH